MTVNDVQNLFNCLYACSVGTSGVAREEHGCMSPCHRWNIFLGFKFLMTAVRLVFELHRQTNTCLTVSFPGQAG